MQARSLSRTTIDSGRGMSRSPSTSAKFTVDNKALAEAVLSYESTQAKPSKVSYKTSK